MPGSNRVFYDPNKKREYVKKVSFAPVRVSPTEVVDKEEEDPFVDVDASCASLKSQLANGVALKEIPRRSLEGANGADKVSKVVNNVMNSKSE